jgi:hypothetical protein
LNAQNSSVKTLKEVQTLSYVLKSISEGKNVEQIAERLDGEMNLVRIWVETLLQIHFIDKNYFNELVITSDGKDFLQKFDLNR